MPRSVSCQTRMLIYLFLKKALQETLKIFKKSNLKYLLTGENLNLKLMYCIIWNSLHYKLGCRPQFLRYKMHIEIKTFENAFYSENMVHPK